MKKVLIKIAIFFKRVSFIYRIVGVLVISYIVFGILIPDIKFNLSNSQAVEMSLAQLLETPADKIPRYLKIKDAVVHAQSYVEYRSAKKNKLKGIYYPVYSENDVRVDLGSAKMRDVQKMENISTIVLSDSGRNISVLKKTDKMQANLVIHDSRVTDADLDSTGKYFSNPTFTIEGQYNGDKLDAQTLDTFDSSGLNVSKDAIVLNRGTTGTSTGNAVIFIVIGLLTVAFVAASFVPERTLVSGI